MEAETKAVSSKGGVPEDTDDRDRVDLTCSKRRKRNAFDRKKQDYDDKAHRSSRADEEAKAKVKKTRGNSRERRGRHGGSYSDGSLVCVVSVLRLSLFCVNARNETILCRFTSKLMIILSVYGTEACFRCFPLPNR